MALRANALVDLQTAKDHLGIGTADFDARIEQLINTASQMIESHTSRRLVTQSYIEYQDGRASNKILLKNYPIVGGPAVGSKPEIRIDNSSEFGATSIIDPSEYYVDKENMIVLIGQTFPKGYRNIRIDYDAGVGTLFGDDIPSDLQWACLELLSWYYNSTSNHRVGIVNQSKGGENVTFVQRIPEHIELLLEPYMRMEFPEANVQVRNV